MKVTIFYTLLLCIVSNSAQAQLGRLSSKKGVCITTKKQNADKWKGRVDSLNVSWHYNWATRINMAEPQGVDYVPHDLWLLGS